MSRQVTIIMDDKTAILLMDFLGMHSETTVKNLYETIKKWIFGFWHHMFQR